MSSTSVALVRCDDYDPGSVAQAVRRQFDLLGGLERFVKPGDSVLLKPNMIAPRSHHVSAAQTHPTVILEVARLLKDFGVRPFVADSPAWTNTATCARALELIEPLRKLGVPIRQLDAPRKCRLGPGKPRVGISSAALDADAIINLAKFKAHQQLVATFAVKNMFGCISGKRKAIWHFKKGGNPAVFCEMLIDIYRYLGPALTLIDGIVVMEGQGPIRGPSRPLGWLIGGADPIACERVCCRLIGIQPQQVPIIRTAERIGFGCPDLDQVEILGDALPPPCPDFRMPDLTPVRFSFLHVCRSIARQVLFLARGRRATRSH
ncbi:MAG: hypothetical protein A2Y76_00240 [Planctomycetes bacterium RBG_13_60_9]|nr:MAG: hypothetical protein A2Y76_00240 [Planctomycetes bacterium RBG_13_60_9]